MKIKFNGENVYGPVEYYWENVTSYQNVYFSYTDLLLNTQCRDIEEYNERLRKGAEEEGVDVDNIVAFREYCVAAIIDDINVSIEESDIIMEGAIDYIMRKILQKEEFVVRMFCFELEEENKTILFTENERVEIFQ